MKQSTIGKFFGKPAVAQTGAKPLAPSNAARQVTAQAKEVKTPEKKRVRDEAVPASAASSPIPAPAAASASPAAVKTAGKSRLKRLKKNPSAEAKAVIEAENLEDCEDPIEETGSQQAKATAEEAAAKASAIAADTPSEPIESPSELAPSDRIEDSDKEGATKTPQPIAAAKGKAKGPSQKKESAAKQRKPKGSAPSPEHADELAAAGVAAEEPEEAAASESRSGSELESAEEDEGASAKKLKKMAILKPPGAKQKPGKGKEKVEGVGTGALAAAMAYSSFDVTQLATWQAGDPVPFSFLAKTFDSIATTTKRLEIIKMLVGAFRAILATTPEDLLPIVYLCTNQIAPSHEGLELGIGDSILVKALAQATGKSMQKVKAEYDKEGDLGTVAANARSSQKTMFQSAPLTVRAVFKQFRDIAAVQGNKSQDKKIQLITKLLVSSRDLEPGYIMRALQGKLRIGLGEESVVSALAHAQLLHRGGSEDADGALANRLERAVQAVKQAVSQCPSYDVLIPALLKYPLEDLPEHVRFIPGVPVKPMLAKPTTGISEVLDKFTDQEFTCEYKYDGERAQIHLLDNGKVFIYSRNSENNTQKYPDIAASVPGLVKEGVQSVVLDCEAVAFERETGRILPFQVLSTRKRKDVEVADIKVQVCLFAFDCLYLNGEMLLQRPLTERRKALLEAVEEKPGELQYALYKTSTDVEELGTFLNESVTAGTEGLIVKTMDSTYEPSKRSSHWLKLKKDYLEGVGDTLDVVVIGAWFGKGKRSGVYGAFLLAVYNQDAEEFQTISKIGTGFSEEQLKQFSEQLKEYLVPSPKPYYRYSETLIPDVWFDTKTVWEVKCADFSISPRHKAAIGLVDAEKGISIRFPRLVRVRDDKAPEDATSAEQIADMYRSQAIANQKGNKEED
ncbi:hypothetical protein CVIRNUC_009603 [Coccomyxa viridis]|uniref:DNA ligase n=1 Tax=Coccomyxa viridis TaxID=1274662 RepID=A0AAV1IJK6_9CHLO|nr:hypothetical protein CVIRNUC_009603 [Coccomyxa viridis]